MSLPLQADVLTNSSFEAYPSPAHDQGLLPTGWRVAWGPSYGADTYDTTLQYGLWPGEYSHFAGVTARDGNRWVAGWNGGPEAFGQTLATALTPGAEYVFTAWLHLDPYLNGAGAYRLYLANQDASDPLLLGALDSVSDLTQWVERSLTFTAPSGAGTHPFFVLEPYQAPGVANWAYPGIDMMSLEQTSAPGGVPEAGTFVLAAPVVAGLLLRRRRRH
jgi:hypothetical protein